MKILLSNGSDVMNSETSLDTIKSAVDGFFTSDTDFSFDYLKKRAPVTYVNDPLDEDKSVYIIHSYGDTLFPTNPTYDYWQQLSCRKRISILKGNHGVTQFLDMPLRMKIKPKILAWFNSELSGGPKVSQGVEIEKRSVDYNLLKNNREYEFYVDLIKHSEKHFLLPQSLEATKSVFQLNSQAHHSPNVFVYVLCFRLYVLYVSFHAVSL